MGEHYRRGGGLRQEVRSEKTLTPPSPTSGGAICASVRVWALAAEGEKAVMRAWGDNSALCGLGFAVRRHGRGGGGRLRSRRGRRRRGLRGGQGCRRRGQ